MQGSPTEASPHRAESPLLPPTPGSYRYPSSPVELPKKLSFKKVLLIGVGLLVITGITIGTFLSTRVEQEPGLTITNPLRIQGSTNDSLVLNAATGFQFLCISSCLDKGDSVFVTLKTATSGNGTFDYVNCYSEQATSCKWYSGPNCGGLSSPSNVKTGNYYLRTCPYSASGFVGTTMHWCNEARSQLQFGRSMCGKTVVGPLGKAATPTTSTIQPTSSFPVSSNGKCGSTVGTSCGTGVCCSQYGWCGTTQEYCSNCQPGYGQCSAQTTTLPPPPNPPVQSTSGGPGIIGYFPNWGPDFAAFDLSGVDVINYAFISVDANGNLVSNDRITNPWGLIYKLNVVGKSKYPNLRTVVSIGGWTDSRYFSVVAADATRRARFVNACWNYIIENRFDGVDVDWEFPGQVANGNTYSIQDAANFLLLLKELRVRFGPIGASGSKLVTIAASTMIDIYKGTVGEVGQTLDWINVVSIKLYLTQ
jgi:hypothetical protein